VRKRVNEWERPELNNPVQIGMADQSRDQLNQLRNQDLNFRLVLIVLIEFVLKVLGSFLRRLALFGYWFECAVELG